MKKGFTLVELLAVIALLGIIMFITVPIITSVLSSAKSSLNSEQEEMIVMAARNWGVTNASSNTKGYVTIKELQASGYLSDSKVKNLVNKSDLSLSSKVCIKYENNQYVYTYKGNEAC